MPTRESKASPLLAALAGALLVAVAVIVWMLVRGAGGGTDLSQARLDLDPPPAAPSLPGIPDRPGLPDAPSLPTTP